MPVLNKTKRVLAAGFGAVLIGIATPLLYVLLAGVPASLMGFVWLAASGVAAGAVLGALFPRVFGFVFEAFLEA